jgi:hypothetical protein
MPNAISLKGVRAIYRRLLATTSEDGGPGRWEQDDGIMGHGHRTVDLAAWVHSTIEHGTRRMKLGAWVQAT